MRKIENLTLEKVVAMHKQYINFQIIWFIKIIAKKCRYIEQNFCFLVDQSRVEITEFTSTGVIESVPKRSPNSKRFYVFTYIPFLPIIVRQYLWYNLGDRILLLVRMHHRSHKS